MSDARPRGLTNFSNFAAIFALLVGYPALAELAHTIGPVGGFTTPVWPAAGLALAVLLLAGNRFWPALFLGATVAHLLVGRPPLTAILIAVGATVEAVAGTWLVRRFAAGARAFEHVRSVLAFLLLAGLLTPLAGASLAIIGLHPPQVGSAMPVGRLWLVHWLSNGAGIMTATPLIVLWATDRNRTWTVAAVAERLLLGVALIWACEAVFGVPFGISPGHALTFLFSPILAWAAFRFRLRASALAVCIAAAAAVWGTARGTSPFGRDDVTSALLLLQIFSILLSATTLVVAAGMRELQRAEFQAAREEERAWFLAEASHLLSASLDIDDTLPTLAALAIPRIADWSAVHLVESDGTIRQVAVAHVDPEKQRDVQALFASATRAGSPSSRGSRNVIRTGEPELLTDIPDAMIEESAQSPEQLALLRSLGLKSYLCVPVRAGRRVLGAITFASTRDDRRYGRADLDLAQALADRAAIALENARLYAHAQEAVRIREDFLSIASHELRTPLTALRLQITLLERALAHGPSERARQTIESLARDLAQQGERLTTLVNGLFDVTAISAGKLELDVVDSDLRDIVDKTVQSLRPLALEHGVQIGVEAPEPVPGRWDASRLTQVVANLVSNAIKYGEAKPVNIRVASEDSVVKLSVCDQGPGIPREYRERIFQRFEQIPRADRASGLGLGLYIARQIVQAHGGKIELDSDASCGALFTVTLPRWTSRHRRRGELHETLAHR